MTDRTYADRSRVLTYQKCPRRRFYEYEIVNGTQTHGLAPLKFDQDLLIGSGVHVGVENLLRGEDIEVAVDRAINGHEDWIGTSGAISSSGLILDPESDSFYLYQETNALVEALIRGYEKVLLPQILERFQVVEVEVEDLEAYQDDSGFILLWGARTDAILMEKSSKDLYAYSLKTAKEFGKREQDKGSHDVQGMSEVAAIESRLNRWQTLYESGGGGDFIPEWFLNRAAEGHPPLVTAVKMDYVLKGRKEHVDGKGWIYSNPLIRPWKKDDGLGETLWAWKYYFTDEMGHNHRLGKGWYRVNIWEREGALREWIERLASEEVQGFQAGEGLKVFFISPGEFFRSPDDIDSWKRQAIAQEKRIALGREEVYSTTTAVDFEKKLDEHFPMYESCDYPKACSFQEACFTVRQYRLKPMDTMSYKPRVPNHPTEFTILK